MLIVRWSGLTPARAENTKGQEQNHTRVRGQAVISEVEAVSDGPVSAGSGVVSCCAVVPSAGGGQSHLLLTGVLCRSLVVSELPRSARATAHRSQSPLSHRFLAKGPRDRGFGRCFTSLRLSSARKTCSVEIPSSWSSGKHMPAHAASRSTTRNNPDDAI